MKTVFFDVDTLFDFVLPAGALYGQGAEHVLPAVAALNQWAAARGIPVVSTTDAHAENDPEFNAWPPHCVAGTLGQQKPPQTLLERRALVGAGAFNIDGAQQIIVLKQSLDCFTNPNLPAILKQLSAERYVVYGFFIEYCVRFAVLGLLETGARVELVTDASKGLNAEDSSRTLAEFTARGGVLTTVKQVCAD